MRGRDAREDEAREEVRRAQVRKVLVELLRARERREERGRERWVSLELSRSTHERSERGRTTATASPSAESCLPCPMMRPRSHLSRCSLFVSSRSSASGSGPWAPAGAHTLSHVSLSVLDDARRYARPKRDRVWTAKWASCDGDDEVCV